MTRKPRPDEVRVRANYGGYGFDYNLTEIVGLSIGEAVIGLLDPRSPFALPRDKAEAFNVQDPKRIKLNGEK